MILLFEHLNITILPSQMTESFWTLAHVLQGLIEIILVLHSPKVFFYARILCFRGKKCLRVFPIPHLHMWYNSKAICIICINMDSPEPARFWGEILYKIR